VSYELTDTGGCVLLRVTHDSWQEGDPSRENTKKGWWKLLSAIKTWAETGETLDLSGAGAHG